MQQGQIIDFRAMSLLTAFLLCTSAGVSAFRVTSAVVSSHTRRQHSRYAFTMTANPRDLLPEDAKRGYVRPDRLLDIISCTPQLLLRLGSGAFVDGYKREEQAG